MDALSFLFGIGVQEDLFDCEFIALLHDAHVLPHRVGDVYNSVDKNLWVSARICDTLEVIARRSNPEGPV